MKPCVPKVRTGLCKGIRLQEAEFVDYKGREHLVLRRCGRTGNNVRTKEAVTLVFLVCRGKRRKKNSFFFFFSSIWEEKKRLCGAWRNVVSCKDTYWPYKVESKLFSCQSFVSFRSGVAVKVSTLRCRRYLEEKCSHSLCWSGRSSARTARVAARSRQVTMHPPVRSCAGHKAQLHLQSQRLLNHADVSGTFRLHLLDDF